MRVTHVPQRTTKHVPSTESEQDQMRPTSAGAAKSIQWPASAAWPPYSSLEPRALKSRPLLLSHPTQAFN
eukprot:720053-Pelagomonas_calceolata.AAC.4